MRSLFRMLMLAGAVSAPSLALADDKPAAAPDEKTPSCVHARMISGWSRIDDRTVVIRSTSKQYLVTFLNVCRETNWAFGARVNHYGMCLRPGDTLVFSMDPHPLGSRWPHWGARWTEHGFEQRCFIKSIELLPPGWTPPPKK